MKQPIKTYKKLITFCLSLIIILSIAIGLYLYWSYQYIGLVLIFVIPILSICLIICIIKYSTSSQNKLNKIYNELTMQDMPRKLPIAAMKIDDKETILYANQKAKEIFGQMESGTFKLKDIGIDLSISSLPLSGHTVLDITAKNKSYQLNAVSFLDHGSSSKHRSAYLYFLDTSELNELKKKRMQNAPSVVIIDVDGGESTMLSITERSRTSILPALDTLIYNFANEINGVMRSPSAGRYIIFTEAQYIETQKKKKFPILESVRSISSEISLTLSIGISSNESAKKAEIGALQALEMATARGGDQAVIKTDDNFTFFGANKEGVSIRSKVKSRLFAGRLMNYLSGSKDIFIMGHAGEDADALGAAYAVYSIAQHLGKNAYIVLSDKPTATNIINLMKEENVSFLSKREAINNIKTNSSVVVVDTLRQQATAEPKLYETALSVIAIDHHRKGKETFAYKDVFHEPGASSVCEMMTEVVQYVPSLKITKLQAEVLLAGIMIDTKQFSVGTGPRTYEAAAYLLKQSASPLSIKRLLQEDLVTYELINQAVETADYLESGIAIATMPITQIVQPVLSAKVADELLKIKGVNASFTLTQSQKDVLISARSLGNINVQVIMEKLAGGGHMTMAASSLKDTTLKDAKKLLLDAINNYLQEDQ